MVLIFGGAYQGKLEYAKEHFGKDVFNCLGEEIDFNKTIINNLNEFIFTCNKKGIEAKDYLKENREKLKDKVVICTDNSQGIVPMEREQRDLREMTGRTMIYLAEEAEEVIRIFCGLPQKIK